MEKKFYMKSFNKFSNLEEVLNCNVNKVPELQTISLEILFILEIISQYMNYLGQTMIHLPHSLTIFNMVNNNKYFNLLRGFFTKRAESSSLFIAMSSSIYRLVPNYVVNQEKIT